MVNAEENGDGADGDLEPEQFRKMFIGGLTSTTTDEMLREFYSKWGELVDCVVMRDPATKRSRGFGFVSYKRREEVDEAMKSRPHVIDGKTVDPKRAVPREQSQRSEATVSSKRLYVSGVREDHTEKMFEEYFSQFGPVLKVEIIADKNTGKPRGFAFITFDDYDAVDKCVLQKSHMVSNYRCDVKKALSKEEMSRAQQKERELIERGGRTRGPERGGMRGGSWGGAGDRAGYGGYGYGGSAPSGPGGYGGAQAPWGGQPDVSAGGYGGGYGGTGQGGRGGWGGESGGSWGGPQQGGWGAQGGAGWGQGGQSGWQGGQASGGQSWGTSAGGGQTTWGQRGY